MYFKAEKICETLKQEKDVTADINEIESELKTYYKKRKKALKNDKYSLAYDGQFYAQDALYDVSVSVKSYWDNVYPFINTTKGKYMALLRFVNAREKFLGITHTESVHILKSIGWTPADIMGAYLDNRQDCSILTLSPDVVVDAVHEDMDTALCLLEGNDCNLFPHGYNIYMHYEWIDFMYLFWEYDDRAFLTRVHKSKRLNKHCQEVLERLEYVPAISKETSEEADYPDFSIFDGIILNQKHLMASAAGQRLRKGNDDNGYYVLSFHLVDEEHGYGAAIRFDAFNKAPEYCDEKRKSRGVYFYRFKYLMMFDYVPESWRCSPLELPEDFVWRAYRAFSKLAGRNQD